MIMKNSKNSKASLESPEITSSYNLFLYGMPQSIQTNTDQHRNYGTSSAYLSAFPVICIWRNWLDTTLSNVFG